METVRAPSNRGPRGGHSGAEVKWNDHIGGRQFDVTIRFKMHFTRT